MTVEELNLYQGIETTLTHKFNIRKRQAEKIAKDIYGFTKEWHTQQIRDFKDWIEELENSLKKEGSFKYSEMCREIRMRFEGKRYKNYLELLNETIEEEKDSDES